MNTTTLTLAYTEATAALRQLEILAHVMGPSMPIDNPQREDLAALLEHPELRRCPMDDEGTRWADIVAVLLAPRAISLSDRELLCDGLLCLVATVRERIDAMAACLRTSEGPDAD
jgi:hypothetical protein